MRQRLLKVANSHYKWQAVNDTAGPDGLVPMLLVFGAYPKMSQLDPPAPTINQRAAAVRKAMEDVSKLRAT